MSDKRQEVLQAINDIEEDDALEKVYMFLTGMLAQQKLDKKTA